MDDDKFKALLERARAGEVLPKYLGEDFFTWDQTWEWMKETNKHYHTKEEFEDLFVAKWTNICGTCGFDWSGTVGYSCQNMKCPVQHKST